MKITKVVHVGARDADWVTIESLLEQYCRLSKPEDYVKVELNRTASTGKWNIGIEIRSSE